MVSFSIDNVPNPKQGQTDGFIIYSRYDNIIVDETDLSNTNQRVLQIFSSPNPLLLLAISFNPRNEGELSNYLFKIIPSSGFQTSTIIIIKFGKHFDLLVGNSLTCLELTFNQQVSCTVKNRMVLISGLSKYQPSSLLPL